MIQTYPEAPSKLTSVCVIWGKSVPGREDSKSKGKEDRMAAWKEVRCE